MTQVPRYAFFVAIGALLAIVFIQFSGTNRNGLVFSVSMKPGHLHLTAELGLPLPMLGG